MKGSGKVLALVLFAVLTACNKENKVPVAAVPEVQEQVARNPARLVYASKWQTLGQWQKDEKGFHARQTLPIKTKGGKVLLFARNVWAADAALEEPVEDIPLQLPFNFLPYVDQPGLTETWQYEVLENEFKVDLKVEGGDVQPRPVQVRCLYIPDSVWTSFKAGEEGLAYEDLVTRLKIEP